MIQIDLALSAPLVPLAGALCSCQRTFTERRSMASVQSPKLDAWQDAHRRASEAEHAVFMASIGYAAGGVKPTDLQLQSALSHRAGPICPPLRNLSEHSTSVDECGFEPIAQRRSRRSDNRFVVLGPVASVLIGF